MTKAKTNLSSILLLLPPPPLQARAQFQNEYQILCQVPPHENIIHMYAFFFDRANPDISPEFKRVGKNMRTMSLFLLMDEHPMSMQEQMDILVAGKGPQVRDWP